MGDVALTLDVTLKLAEIITLVGGGTTVVYKMGRMTSRFELIGEQQAREIS
jgi:hypothetical protein